MTNDEVIQALKMAQETQPPEPMSLQGIDQGAGMAANQFVEVLRRDNARMMADIEARKAERMQSDAVMKAMDRVEQRKLVQKAKTPEDIGEWTERISSGYFKRLNWQNQVRGMVENLGVPGPNKMEKEWTEAFDKVGELVADPEGVVSPVVAHLLGCGRNWSVKNLAVIVAFLLFVSNFTAILLRDGASMIEESGE